MLIRTLASVATGVAVFVFTLSVGLELAVAWGVISFVLNYIPYVGSLIAVVLPVIFATAQFESWQMAAFIFGSLYLIQFVIGSYLEPILTGNALSISPFVMLLAFLAWDFLWGMPGAFIGLPVTIALFTIWNGILDALDRKSHVNNSPGTLTTWRPSFPRSCGTARAIRTCSRTIYIFKSNLFQNFHRRANTCCRVLRSGGGLAGISSPPERLRSPPIKKTISTTGRGASRHRRAVGGRSGLRALQERRESC